MKPDPAALRAASRAIVIAHTWKTLFAIAVLGDFWLGLVGIARREDMVGIARYFIEEGLAHLRPALWTAGVYALAGPLLGQYVLAALLLSPQPVAAALPRYARALALAALRLGALGVAGSGAVLLAYQLPMLVAPPHEALARFVPLALGAGQLLWISTIHDVAAAQLAASDAPRIWRALIRGARASTPKLMAAHLAFTAGGILAYAAGEAASRVLEPSIGFMLSQAFALASSFIGAAWLSIALTRTR